MRLPFTLRAVRPLLGRGLGYPEPRPRFVGGGCEVRLPERMSPPDSGMQSRMGKLLLAVGLLVLLSQAMPSI